MCIKTAISDYFILYLTVQKYKQIWFELVHDDVLFMRKPYITLNM